MNGKFKYMAFALLLALILRGCGAKAETVTFSAEIEKVSGDSILVKTMDYKGFEEASVDLRDAEYHFDPAEGQLVEVTILPEIKESYPVQVTGVKLVYKGEAERKVADYFPFRENVKYTYQGEGNEFSGYEVYNDYVSGDRLQQSAVNGGTETVRVYEVKDGKLTRTFSAGEIYYRENMIQKSGGDEEILLKEPLKKGTSWTLKDGRHRTVTETAKTVQTPAGSFAAVEVVAEGGNGTTVDYYAKGMGLIKTIFQSGGMEVSSALESVEEDAVREQTVRFYYPDDKTDQPRSVEKKVEYRTNDRTEEVLAEAYKSEVEDGLGLVLSTDAAIKSLSLDEKNRVNLDFNDAFLTGMNAGASFETMILQSIANTFGNYYHVDSVILTVEGKPYESGHVVMKQDQAIPVKREE